MSNLTTNSIPPEWAARAFCDRANLKYDAVLVADGDHGIVLRSAVRAGAALVAAHEEPPVDPLYEALKAVVELGRYDTREQTDLLRRELALRGLQIVELAKQEPNP